MEIKYVVNSKENGKKLKDILKDKLYISSILLHEVISQKLYFVNDNFVYTNYLVNENDIIKVVLPNDTSNFSSKFLLKDSPLDILYEDEYILAVNKPKNMPVHPSCDNYENTLSNIVASYLKKQNIMSIHILTRLDKNTTGVCIFAKHKYIQELFTRRKPDINFKKEYIALSYGIISKDHDIIEKNITRMENTIILRKVSEEKNIGDYARTEFFVTKRNYDKNYTVLKVLLHTGRTHQIRVHMSYISHPLLGDELYAPDVLDISSLINRVALHCFALSFVHPMLNKKIEIVAPIPDDIKSLI